MDHLIQSTLGTTLKTQMTKRRHRHLSWDSSGDSLLVPHLAHHRLHPASPPTKPLLQARCTWEELLRTPWGSGLQSDAPLQPLHGAEVGGQRSSPGGATSPPPSHGSFHYFFCSSNNKHPTMFIKPLSCAGHGVGCCSQAKTRSVRAAGEKAERSPLSAAGLSRVS